MHRFELLGGGGGGRVDMADCLEGSRYLNLDEYGECQWAESKGSFVRGYGQLHYGLQRRVVELAVGMRMSVTRYALEELFQQASDRVAWIPALEPFTTVRIESGWKSADHGGRTDYLRHQEHTDLERQVARPLPTTLPNGGAAHEYRRDVAGRNPYEIEAHRRLARKGTDRSCMRW